MATYFLPGYAGTVEGSETKAYEQKAPLYNLYSPRLFGAPPQFTMHCDMRLKSSLGAKPGPVGDIYLDNVLRDAQVANFIVGHARFTGGMSTIAQIIRTCGQYATALSKYDVFEKDSKAANASAARSAASEYSIERYEKELGTDSGKVNANMKRASEMSESFGTDADAYVMDVDSVPQASGILDTIDSIFGGLGVLRAPLKASLGVQQAFYTFEADWSSYIENVKMMINTAIMMLGLSDAKVRIGDTLYPIAFDSRVTKDTDVWTNYRFITPAQKVGSVNSINTMAGDGNQYVSFMIEPVSANESFTNTTGDSSIYSTVLNSGSSIGNEIAFLTNTSRNNVDDALINLSNKAINAAEQIMSNLTLGTGSFTAALMGSMARSYTGDHTIFPKIFQQHTSTSSVTLNIKLRAAYGDPYSYLMEILVPMFHLVAMAIPQMSKNAASAYSYPPLIQLNIPGVWGTRLGIINSLTITKSGNDFSANGYPLAVDISVSIEDLQHVLMSSGMNKPGQMLNNNTMFDYIAQCAGVDKYRINGAIRLVSKIALASAAGKNTFYNFGNAILNDASSWVNRMTGAGDIR